MKLRTVVLVALATLAIALPACAGQAAAADVDGSGATMVSPEKGATESTCTAEAYCEASGIWLSCTGTSSCFAEDQDCDAGRNGIIICDSYDQFCPPCPIDCSGFPPRYKCIDGLTCKSGCNNCGDGGCVGGYCNCRA